MAVADGYRLLCAAAFTGLDTKSRLSTLELILGTRAFSLDAIEQVADQTAYEPHGDGIP